MVKHIALELVHVAGGSWLNFFKEFSTKEKVKVVL